MRYADVSDANLYYGNMRFDVNVSVSKDPDVLGTRTETKNLNSFKSVERAVEYEVGRQIEQLEQGEKIIQETRGWDDAKLKTFTQRSKEEAHDYRYMPDPDIPPIELTDEIIDKVGASMPLMPSSYRVLFAELGLDQSAIDTLIDTPESARFIADVIEQSDNDHAKRIATWMVNSIDTSENEESTEVKTDNIIVGSAIKLSQMVSDNKLSSTAAKEVWLELNATGGDPEKIAESKNLLQVSDEHEIAKIVAQVLADNPKAAEDVKNGEMKAIGFLVGQVMKASQGKANPGLAQELIKKELS
jgi:aspartyl-tRNA(Asn)/glutamyl-tRNA(Gln) amidotransferase subunit B